MKKIILIALSVFLFISSCGPKNTFEGYMEDGAKKFEKGDYDGAIKSYMKAAEFEPDSAVVYNMLGMAYRFKYNQTRDTNYYDIQVEAFKKAISLDPKYSVAIINLATTYYYNDEKELAIPLFKQALKVNPNHPEKHEIEKMIKEFEEKTK